MKTSEELERRIEALAAAYASAIAKEQEREVRYGPEPSKDGAIIAWRMRFQKGGVKYRYAAIRAEGIWYTTGPNSLKGYTWDELVSWIDNAHRVYGFKVLS